MADSKNQHYIPKFYFRQYSGREKQIDVHVWSTDTYSYNVPIKSQSSADYFYGDMKAEHGVTNIENVLRPIISKLFKDNSDEISISTEERLNLIRCILFQRSRTNNEREKNRNSDSEFIKELLREQVTASNPENRDFLLNSLNHITVSYKKPNGTRMILAIDSAYYAMDMGVAILKTNGEIPFIFGDSPVTFYNHFLFNVKLRGVLGLQSPGLIMYFPLSREKCVMVYDRDKYTFAARENFINVHALSNSDVDEINKLQYLNARKCIYFSGRESEDYLKNIWNSIKDIHNPPETQFIKLPGFYHGETASFGEVMQMQEPQIDYLANFSFCRYHPMPVDDYYFHLRNPVFSQEIENMLNERKN